MMIMLAVEMNVINAANFRSAPNWNELRKGADLVLLLVIDCHCSTQWWWSRHRRWSGEGLQERVKHLRQQPLERGRLLLTFIKLKMKWQCLQLCQVMSGRTVGTVRKACALGYYRLVGWLVGWVVITGWKCSNIIVSSVRSSSVYQGLIEIQQQQHPLFQIFQILQIRKWKDPTCAIFFKSMGFEDIEYDIPVYQM